MTDASEVIITDKELSDFAEALQMFDPAPGTEWHARYRQIVCEFIAARVPDAMAADPNSYHYDYDAGHNACRERVLKGE